MLTIEQFKQQEAACRARNPGIFRLSMPDPLASDDQIDAVEAAIECRLPRSYREFLAAHGGGDYATFTVFSANPDSEFYLPAQVAKLQSLMAGNLLPVHDDNAGGLYVLNIVDGTAAETVQYWDWETRELSDQKFDSILDLIAEQVFS